MLLNHFLLWFSIVFLCFSKDFPKGEEVNLSCSICLLCSEGNIFLPARYSYLSNLPDDIVDIFAASLIISYCSFSSLILSSIAMISFYFLSERLHLKSKGLSEEYYY